MENNEITFYLDSNAHALLKIDQKRFHLMNNESILIKRIIVNHYPRYNQEKSKLERKIDEALEYEAASFEPSNITWEIMKYIGENSINKTLTTDKKANKDKIHLRINKNDDDLDIVIDSCPSEASLSEFIANIIYSYLDEPLYEREKIVFKDIYDSLKLAINKNQQIKIKSKSNTRETPEIKIIEPKEICISKEELFNYLLYKGIRNGKECAMSIHLYNIISVILEPNVCSFSEEIISSFNRMKTNGVQFSISDNTIYKIKLTEHGKELYEHNLKYIERPVALDKSDKDSGIYYFDCSKMQFDNYFGSFYEDMEILEPIEYRKEYYNRLINILNKYK